MSKYEPLWKHVASFTDMSELVLTFEQVAEVLGFEIDHSFLGFKKELLEYGWAVGKISMKNGTVSFGKVDIGNH